MATIPTHAPPPAPQPLLGVPLILGAGLATTTLALFGVGWLNANTKDFNIMGWYAWYVLPAGALIVGAVAGSGYGAGSWWSGKRTTGAIVALVLALQLGAYFTAQFLEYRTLDLHFPDGTPVGFWKYFDLLTRAFAWKSKSGEEPGTPFGAMGYAMRALEIIGFSAGGIILPAILWKHPYCERCAQYKRRRELGLLGASAAGPGWFSGKETKAKRLGESADASSGAAKAVEALLDMAQQPDATPFVAALAEMAPGSRAAGKLPKRFTFRILHCPRCHEGQFEVAMLAGQGNQIVRTEAGAVPMHPDVVKTVLGK